MEITYQFSYDYIPSDIVEKEESYNEERRLRKVETIKNIISEYTAKLPGMEYKIEAAKGEGLLLLTCEETDSQYYKEFDEALRAIGITNTTIPQEEKPETNEGYVATPTIDVTEEATQAPDDTAVA